MDKDKKRGNAETSENTNSEASTQKHTPGEEYEYLLMRYARNTFYSPYGLPYHKISSDLRTHGYSADRRDSIMQKRLELLNSQESVFETEGEIVEPRVAYGQYDTLFLRHDINRRWNQRHINMVQNTALTSEDNDTAKPGEISVASHSLALFTCCGVPFMAPGGGVSDPGVRYDDEYPYTAHISVTILQAAYLEEAKLPKEKRSLDYYQRTLEDIIKDTKDLDGLYKIYMSLHSGDMEVEFLCRDVVAAFRLALRINSSIFFDTHCVISSRIMHVKKDGIIRFEKLPENDSMGGITILSKLTCKYDVLIELIGRVDENMLNTDAALFGYYDASLTLDFNQFKCLYPLLCENRLFKDNVFLLRKLIKKDSKNIGDETVFKLVELKDRDKCPRNTNREMNDMCADCPVKTLIRELALGPGSAILSFCIDYLVSGKAIGTGAVENSIDMAALQKKRGNQNEGVNEVRESIKCITDRITYIRHMNIVLPLFRYQFMSVTGMLIDLVNIFLPMGTQPDLHVDWYMFKGFLEAFLEGVIKLVKEIKAGMNAYETQLKAQDSIQRNINENESVEKIWEYCNELTGFLIDLLRRGVSGMNTFARLVQGVNLQVFSMVNYELLTRVNAKKLIIALSEYNDLLSIACSHAYKSSKQIRQFRTLAIPDINSKQPETLRLFPHGRLYRKWIGETSSDSDRPSYCDPDGKTETHPILVRMPGIEMFMRVYDSLLQAHHEFFHHRHFYINGKDNSERNLFVARLAFYQVSDEMIYSMFTHAGYDFSRFYLRGANKHYRIIKREITEFMLEEFCKYRQALSEMHADTVELKDVLFSHLKSAITSFAESYFSESGPLFTGISMSRKVGVDEFTNTLLRYCVSEATSERVRRLKTEAYIADADGKEKMYEDAAALAAEVIDEYLGWIQSSGLDIQSLDYKKIAGTVYLEITAVNEYFHNSLRSPKYIEPSETTPDGCQKAPRTPEDFASAFEQLLKKQLADAAKSAKKDKYRDAMELQSLTRANDVFPKSVSKWWRLPKTTISRLVTEAVSAYNEFISDLCMCVTVGADVGGIDELGYLFVRTVQMLNSVDETVFDMADRAHFLRMRMVVSALTGGSGDNQFAIRRDKLEKFLEVKCKSISERLKSRIRRKMEANYNERLFKKRCADLDKEYDMFLETVLDYMCPYDEHGSVSSQPGRKPLALIASDVYHGLFLAFPSLEKCDFGDNERDDLLRLADEFHRIVTFVTLSALINEAEAVEPLDDGDGEFTKHMTELHLFLTSSPPDPADKTIREAWSEVLDTPLLMPIKKIGNRIADCYNGKAGDFAPRDMLHDSVNFIMNAYYNNRVRIMESASKTGGEEQ